MLFKFNDDTLRAGSSLFNDYIGLYYALTDVKVFNIFLYINLKKIQSINKDI